MEFILKTANDENPYTIINTYPHLMSFNVCTNDAGNFVNDNTLTVYIKRIREKLGNEEFIKTIKGIGYRVDSEWKKEQRKL